MRYRLSTLLTLFVIVGLALGWWRDHRRLAQQVEMQRLQIHQMQEYVEQATRSYNWISTETRFKSVDELVAFLQDATHDEVIREDWTAWTNTWLADRATPALCELLSDEREDTRRSALNLLRFIAMARRPLQHDPIPALMAAVNDPSTTIRAETYDALGHFRADEAVPILREIMDGDDGFESFIALKSVKEIDPSIDVGPRLRELYWNSEPWLWTQVAWALPDYLPADEARRLLETRSQQETDPDSLQALAMALNKIRE